MIYFIQDSKLSYIKIGYTSSSEPDGRLKALQTGNAANLSVIFTMPGDQPAELRLHEKFAGSREVGEWFRPTPDLIGFIVNAARDAGEVDGKVARYEIESQHPSGRWARGGPGIKPMPWPCKIYLAGKIAKWCWRHSIVTDLRTALDDQVPSCPSGGLDDFPTWPVLPRAIFGEHAYVGPYFASCDHGCFHGDDSHGIAAYAAEWDEDHGARTGQDEVNSACLRAVERCDLLFAYIDSPDCYGTVAEVGYAAALGKRIWITGPKFFRDMWFVYKCADWSHGDIREPALQLKHWLDLCRPKLAVELTSPGNGIRRNGSL